MADRLPNSGEQQALDYAAALSLGSGITQGWLFGGHDGSGSVRAMVKRSIRDLEANKARSYVHTYEISSLADGAPASFRETSPFPLQAADAVIFSPSPSGKRLAVISEQAKDKDGGGGGSASKSYIIELWGNTDGERGMLDRIATSSLHDKVMGDSWFGGFSWSADESRAVYVAQKPAPKTRSFFSEAPKESEAKPGQEVPAVGEQFAFRQDWGEKYDGVVQLGLFVVDFNQGKVIEVKVPEDITPGQPQLSKDGRHVVYTAWTQEPRKLGMIYCYQRPCKLYSVAIDPLPTDPKADTPAVPKPICLTPGHRLARSLRFSPDGTKVVWLSNEEGFDTHNGGMRLASAPWDAQGGGLGGDPKILVDLVQNPSSPEAFPGLWLDQLSSDCWTPDGAAVYLTSEWRSSWVLLKIDANSGEVTRVESAQRASRQDDTTGSWQRSSCSLLAVGAAGVLVVGSSPNSPGGLAFVPHNGGEAILGPHPGLGIITSGIRGVRARALELRKTISEIKWKVLQVPPEDDPKGLPFEAILLQPGGEKGSVPLVVYPHGGPHGCRPTLFSHEYAYICAQGYAVVLVNFRGSTGFGQGPLLSLPGKIGTQDVSDVLAATRAAMQAEGVDKERVGVYGGSHGGFLAAHMSGQWPELYKVAVVHNPVTNIAAMVTTSDIPDWCWVEALGEPYDFDSFKAPARKDLDTMFDVSPVAHIDKVVAPTLVLIGAKDRRVPQSQGIEWYHALKSRGVATKLLLYPEDVHAIDKPASDADRTVNIMAWLKQHL